MHWEWYWLFMVFSEFTGRSQELKNREMKNSFKLAVIFVLSMMLAGCKKEQNAPS
jgi:hypothetical protein